MEKAPQYTERDLAYLLNLWIKYTVEDEKYPRIIFKKCAKIDGSIGLIGDSYANEFVKNLVDSGFVDKSHIIKYLNVAVAESEAQNMIEGISALIFIYTEPNLLSGIMEEKLNVINSCLKKDQLSYRLVDWHDLEAGQLRWSKPKSIIKVFKKTIKSLSLEMKIVAKLKKLKRVHIYCGDRLIETWDASIWKMPKTEVIDIPEECFVSGRARLKFISDKAVTPKSLGINSDTRKLGFMVESFRLINKSGKNIVMEQLP